MLESGFKLRLTILTIIFHPMYFFHYTISSADAQIWCLLVLYKADTVYILIYEELRLLNRIKVKHGVWKNKGVQDVKESQEERWDDMESTMWVLLALSCSIPLKLSPEAKLKTKTKTKRCLCLCLSITTENIRFTVITYMYVLSDNRLKNKGLSWFFLTDEKTPSN